mmetsp:Transcript_20142/g.47038  ORF Transcript_20142/g.47038 Transcript_20142/m.47038 type:complete len:6215 (+) Transcript_20142:20-18664(+)
MGVAFRAVLLTLWLASVGAQDSSSFWQNVVPRGDGPPGRRAHASAYLADSFSLVVFGGFLSTGETSNGTLELSLANMQWAQSIESASVAPPARGFATFTSISPTSALLFGGIDSDGVQHADMWNYSIAERWKPVAVVGQTPGALYSHTAVNTHIGLVIFGGRTKQGSDTVAKPTSNTWVFTTTNNTWYRVQAEPTPNARYGHVAVEFSGAMYIFGGLGDSLYGDMWKLDMQQLTWKALPSQEGEAVPSPRSYHAAVVLGLFIVVNGGHVDGANFGNGETWAFDPANQLWTKLVEKTASVDVAQHTFTVVSQTNAVGFGGWTSQAQSSRALRSYLVHPAIAYWSDIIPSSLSPQEREGAVVHVMPTPAKVRASSMSDVAPSNAAYAHDLLWVIGGSPSPGVRLDDMWFFSMETNLWTRPKKPVGASPGPIAYAASLSYGHHILILGGGAKGSGVWAFSTPSIVWQEIKPAVTVDIQHRIFHTASFLEGTEPTLVLAAGMDLESKEQFSDLLALKITPTTRNPPTDRMLEFDGANDVVVAWQDEEIPSGKLFAVDIWFRISNALIDGMALVAWAVSSGESARLYFDALLQVMCMSGFNATQGASCGRTRLSDDNWHHVSAVFDTMQGTSKLFIDGHDDLSPGDPGVQMIEVPLSSLIIGSYTPPSVPYILATRAVTGRVSFRFVKNAPVWSGMIDRVRVWAAEPTVPGNKTNSTTHGHQTHHLPGISPGSHMELLGCWDFDIVTTALKTPDCSNRTAGASLGSGPATTRPSQLVSTRPMGGDGANQSWTTAAWETLWPNEAEHAIAVPRYGHSMVRLGVGSVLLYGGRNKTHFLSSGARFDLGRKEWSAYKFPTMHSVAHHVLIPISVADSSSLLFIGGVGEGGAEVKGTEHSDLNLRVIAADNTLTNTILSIAPALSPTLIHTGATMLSGGTTIILFGGRLDSVYSNSIFSLDVTNPILQLERRRTAGQAPPVRLQHPPSDYGETSLFYSGTLGNENTFWKIRQSTMQWQRVPSNLTTPQVPGFVLARMKFGTGAAARGSRPRLLGQHCVTANFEDPECAITQDLYQVDADGNWAMLPQHQSPPSKFSPEASPLGVFTLYPEMCGPAAAGDSRCPPMAFTPNSLWDVGDEIEFKIAQGQPENYWAAVWASNSRIADPAPHCPKAVVPTKCSGIQIFDSPCGSFTDGSGPANYAVSLSCTFAIQPQPQVGHVFLYFSEFELEEPFNGNCFYDYVEIYDGASTRSPLLGKYCGSVAHNTTLCEGGPCPPLLNINGSSSALLLVFASDYRRTDAGFAASWLSTSMAAQANLEVVETFGAATLPSVVDNNVGTSFYAMGATAGFDLGVQCILQSVRVMPAGIHSPATRPPYPGTVYTVEGSVKGPNEAYSVLGTVNASKVGAWNEGTLVAGSSRWVRIRTEAGIPINLTEVRFYGFQDLEELGPDYDILSSFSHDGGSTWSAPIPVNTNAWTDEGDDRHPQLLWSEASKSFIVVWDSSETFPTTFQIGPSENLLVSQFPRPNNEAFCPGPTNPEVQNDAQWDMFLNGLRVATQGDEIRVIGSSGSVVWMTSSVAGATWSDPTQFSPTGTPPALWKNGTPALGATAAPEVTHVPSFLTFEAGQVMDWLPGPDNSLNWTIGNNAAVTGTPSKDVTLNTTAGHYMHTPAATEAGVAAIYSPCLDLRLASASNLSWWWYMASEGAGQLHVEVAVCDKNVRFTPAGQGAWKRLFSRIGNHGTSWHFESVSLATYVGGRAQLRFRGITGHFVASDMSIDEVIVSTIAPRPAVLCRACSKCLGLTWGKIRVGQRCLTTSGNTTMSIVTSLDECKEACADSEAPCAMLAWDARGTSGQCYRFGGATCLTYSSGVSTFDTYSLVRPVDLGQRADIVAVRPGIWVATYQAGANIYSSSERTNTTTVVKAEVVSPDIDTHEAKAPALVSDGSKILVLWISKIADAQCTEDDHIEGRCKFSILSAVSNDDAATWVDFTKVTTDLTVDNGPPRAARSTKSGAIVAVWHTCVTTRRSDSVIYFARTTGIGSAWSAPARLGTFVAGTVHRAPAVATDSNGTWVAVFESNILLANDELKQDWDVSLAVSRDDGLTWGNSVSLTSSQFHGYEIGASVEYHKASGKWLVSYHAATSNFLADEGQHFVLHVTESTDATTWTRPRIVRPTPLNTDARLGATFEFGKHRGVVWGSTVVGAPVSTLRATSWPDLQTCAHHDEWSPPKPLTAADSHDTNAVIATVKDTHIVVLWQSDRVRLSTTRSSDPPFVKAPACWLRWDLSTTTGTPAQPISPDTGFTTKREGSIEGPVEVVQEPLFPTPVSLFPPESEEAHIKYTTERFPVEAHTLAVWVRYTDKTPEDQTLFSFASPMNEREILWDRYGARITVGGADASVPPNVAKKYIHRQWQHLVVTVTFDDREDVVAFYQDGVLLHRAVNSLVNGGMLKPFSEGRIFLGQKLEARIECFDATSSDCFRADARFKGYMSQFYVFASILPANDIVTLKTFTTDKRAGIKFEQFELFPEGLRDVTLKAEHWIHEPRSGTGLAYNPTVTPFANKLFTVFEASTSSTSDFDIFVAVSDDHGATWQPQTRLHPTMNSDIGDDAHVTVGVGFDTQNQPQLLAVWVRDSTGSLKALMTSRSLDGVTWTEPARLVKGDLDIRQRPTVAGDHMGVWMAVWSLDDGQSSEIMLSRSLDGGATWLAPTRPSERRFGDARDNNPTVFLLGNRWSIISESQSRYFSIRGTNDRITPDLGSDVDLMFTTVPRNGNFRCEPINDYTREAAVLNMNGWLRTMSFDYSNNTIVMATAGQTDAGSDVEFNRKVNRRGKWVHVAKFSGVANASQIAFEQNSLSVCTSGSGTWIAVWGEAHLGSKSDVRDQTVKYVVSHDDGITWNPPSSLFHSVTQRSGVPRIQVNCASSKKADGDWMIVWSSAAPNRTDINIWYAKLTAAGAIKTQPEVLNANAAYDKARDLAPVVKYLPSTNRWLCAWETDTNADGTLDYDIDLMSSQRPHPDTSVFCGGTTYKEETTGPGTDNFGHTYLRTAVGSGVVVAVWESRNTNKFGRTDIWYSHSTDNGVVWSPAALLVPTSDTANSFPDVKHAGNGRFVVTWMRLREPDSLGLITPHNQYQLPQDPLSFVPTGDFPSPNSTVDWVWATGSRKRTPLKDYGPITLTTRDSGGTMHTDKLWFGTAARYSGLINTTSSAGQTGHEIELIKDFPKPNILRLKINPAHASTLSASINIDGGFGCGPTNCIFNKRALQTEIGPVTFGTTTDARSPTVSRPPVYQFLIPHSSDDFANVTFEVTDLARTSLSAKNLSLPATIYIAITNMPRSEVEGWVVGDFKCCAPRVKRGPKQANNVLGAPETYAVRTTMLGTTAALASKPADLAVTGSTTYTGVRPLIHQELSPDLFTRPATPEAVSIAADASGNLIVVWTNNVGGDEGVTDLMWSRSPDGGWSWDKDPQTLPSSTRVDVDPRVAFEVPQSAAAYSGRNLTAVVVWRALTVSSNAVTEMGGDWDLRVTRSFDLGATWETSTVLNDNAMRDSGVDMKPAVAGYAYVDGSTVKSRWVVAYQSDDSMGGKTGTDFDIMSVVSLDHGATWSSPAPVHPHAYTDEANDIEPALTVSATGEFMCAWSSDSDLNGVTGTDYDILVAKSTDGSTWSATRTLNPSATSDIVHERYVSMAASSGLCHAVWSQPVAPNSPKHVLRHIEWDCTVATGCPEKDSWSFPSLINSNGREDSGFDSAVDLAVSSTSAIAAWSSSSRRLFAGQRVTSNLLWWDLQTQWGTDLQLLDRTGNGNMASVSGPVELVPETKFGTDARVASFAKSKTSNLGELQWETSNFPTRAHTMGMWVYSPTDKGSSLVSYTTTQDGTEFGIFNLLGEIVIGRKSLQTGLLPQDYAREWHHVMVGWESEHGRTVVYIDGIQRVVTEFQKGAILGPRGDLRIGANYFYDSNPNISSYTYETTTLFTGKLAHIMLFNGLVEGDVFQRFGIFRTVVPPPRVIGSDSDIMYAQLNDDGSWGPVDIINRAMTDLGSDDSVKVVQGEDPKSWIAMWISSDHSNGTVPPDPDVMQATLIDGRWTRQKPVNMAAADDEVAERNVVVARNEVGKVVSFALSGFTFDSVVRDLDEIRAAAPVPANVCARPRWTSHAQTEYAGFLPSEFPLPSAPIFVSTLGAIPSAAPFLLWEQTGLTYSGTPNVPASQLPQEGIFASGKSSVLAFTPTIAPWYNTTIEAQPVRNYGPAFDPSVSKHGRQRWPQTATNENKYAVVVWVDAFKPSTHLDIYCMRTLKPLDDPSLGGLSGSNWHADLWSDVIPVGGGVLHDSYPSITAGQFGVFIVVWAAVDLQLNPGATFCSRSTDNGMTWSTPVQLAPPPATNTKPHVLATPLSAVVLAVWSTIGPGGDLDVAYVRSSDSGVSWTPFEYLNTNFDVDAGDDAHPRLGADGNGTWLTVWHSDNSLADQVGTDQDILLSRSFDDGKHWSVPVPLNSNAMFDSGNDTLAAIAVAGESAMVVWQSQDSLGNLLGTDWDILYAVSTDSGLSWSTPMPVDKRFSSDSDNDVEATVYFGGGLYGVGDEDWFVAWASRGTGAGVIKTARVFSTVRLTGTFQNEAVEQPVVARVDQLTGRVELSVGTAPPMMALVKSLPMNSTVATTSAIKPQLSVLDVQLMEESMQSNVLTSSAILSHTQWQLALGSGVRRFPARWGIGSAMISTSGDGTLMTMGGDQHGRPSDKFNLLDPATGLWQRGLCMDPAATPPAMGGYQLVLEVSARGPRALIFGALKDGDDVNMWSVQIGELMSRSSRFNSAQLDCRKRTDVQGYTLPGTSTRRFPVWNRNLRLVIFGRLALLLDTDEPGKVEQGILALDLVSKIWQSVAGLKNADKFVGGYSALVMPPSLLYVFGAHTVSDAVPLLKVANFDLPSPSVCGASGPNIASASTGEVAIVDVLARTAFGGPADPSALTMELVGNNLRINGRKLETAVALGVYRFTYVANVPGQYDLRIKTLGQHIVGSPFKIEVLPGAILVSKSSVDTSSITHMVAGGRNRFLIHAKDPFGNAVQGGDDVSVILLNEGTATKIVATVRDKQDGTYTVNFGVTRSGTYQMSSIVSGVHLPGSPMTVTIIPGPPTAANCILSGPGIESSSLPAGSGHNIKIKSRDSFFNAVNFGIGHKAIQPQFFARIGSRRAAVKGDPIPLTDLTVSVVDNEDGTYVITYFAFRQGNFIMEATLLGQTLPGMPFSVDIEPVFIVDEDDKSRKMFFLSLLAPLFFGAGIVFQFLLLLKEHLADRPAHGSDDGPQQPESGDGNRKPLSGFFNSPEFVSWIASREAPDPTPKSPKSVDPTPKSPKSVDLKGGQTPTEPPTPVTPGGPSGEFGDNIVGPGKARWSVDESLKALDEWPNKVTGYKDLAEFMLFFVLFILLLMLQLQPLESYELNSGLQALIEGYQELGVIDDFWDYIETVIVEKVFVNKWYTGEAYTTDELGYFQHYNKLVGGVQFVQTRGVEQKCEDSLYEQFYGNCHTDVVDTSDFSANRSDINFTFDETHGGHTMFLSVANSKKEAQELVAQYKRNRWIDKNTRDIKVKFAAFNGEKGMFSFVVIEWYYGAGGIFGGHARNTAIIQSANMEPYKNNVWDWARLVLECLFLTMVGMQVMAEMHDFATSVHEGGISQYLADLWNIIDLTNLATMLAFIAMRWFYLQYIFDNPIVLPSNKYRPELEEVAARAAVVLFIVVLNVFCKILLLLKHFEFQPRMSIINNTLKIAFLDLLHFMILFFLIFLSFASLVILLFGPHRKSFSTWGRALQTLAEMMIGNFDYAEIHEISPLMSTLVFWLYILLVMFVLVNIFLAIIVDSYAEAKGMTENAMSIPDDVSQLFTKAKKSLTFKGTHREPSIHEALEYFSERNTESITASDLAWFLREKKAMQGTDLSETVKALKKVPGKIEEEEVTEVSAEKLGDNIIRSAWVRYDKNADGKMSPAELTTFLNDVPRDLTTQQIRTIVAMSDPTHKGYVAYPEFRSLFRAFLITTYPAAPVPEIADYVGVLDDPAAVAAPSTGYNPVFQPHGNGSGGNGFGGAAQGIKADVFYPVPVMNPVFPPPLPSPKGSAPQSPTQPPPTRVSTPPGPTTMAVTQNGQGAMMQSSAPSSVPHTARTQQVHMEQVPLDQLPPEAFTLGNQPFAHTPREFEAAQTPVSNATPAAQPSSYASNVTPRPMSPKSPTAKNPTDSGRFLVA